MQITPENVKQAWGFKEDKQIETVDLGDGLYAFKSTEDRIFRIAFNTTRAILGKFVIEDNVVYVTPSTFNEGIDPEVFGDAAPRVGFDSPPGSGQIFVSYDDMMTRLSNITGQPARRLQSDAAMQDFRPAVTYAAKMCPITRELHPLDSRFVKVNLTDEDGVIREIMVSPDAIVRLTPQE